jgi:hypothetical protein
MIQRSALGTALLLGIAACTTPASEGGLDPAPVITSIQISPDSASLQVGDSIAFGVSAHLSDGSTASVPVGWAATGGTVSAGEVYHAGTTPGSYLIIVSTAQLQYVDTAVVVIH